MLRAYALVEAGAPMVSVVRSVPDPAPGEVQVEVAGCGLCHTDVGFACEGVRTRHGLPLILGHEISGVVRRAGPAFRHLEGRGVVVPAVINCGACEDCLAGHPMICKRQVMPGNDRDGGFASVVVVPARGVSVLPPAAADPDAPLPGRGGPTLRHFAVVADAVSTAYQAVKRAGVGPDSVVVVVGLGGVGGYAAQIATAMGALVVGMDPSGPRREMGETLGLRHCWEPGDATPRELRDRVHQLALSMGRPVSRWSILECSGTASGQRTAYAMLVSGATLMVVGYTRERIALRLSNLMAFEARALGTWGCDPALFGEVLSLVLEGRIDIVTPTELRPLETIASAFDDLQHHAAHRRIVLVP